MCSSDLMFKSYEIFVTGYRDVCSSQYCLHIHCVKGFQMVPHPSTSYDQQRLTLMIGWGLIFLQKLFGAIWGKLSSFKQCFQMTLARIFSLYIRLFNIHSEAKIQ